MGLRMALLLVLLSAGSARGDDLAASKAAYADGKKLFSAGDFRGALARFKVAYMKYDAPALLYNIGQCHLKLGEKGQALNFFRTYLTYTASAPDRVELEQLVRQLERELEPAPAPAAVVAPAPVARDSRPLVKKPWFWATVGGAVVVVGVSLGRRPDSPAHPRMGRFSSDMRAAALVALLSGCTHVEGTALLVEVTAQPAIEGVAALHVIANAGGRQREVDLTVTGGRLEQLSFGIQVPASVSGLMVVTVRALDAEQSVLAAATEEIQLESGKSLRLGISLSSARDDLAHPDLAAGSDLSEPFDLAPEVDADLCGDGVVQSYEQCDDGLGSTQPCPKTGSECDDQAPATADSVVGERCQARCEHTPILVNCTAGSVSACPGKGLVCGPALPSSTRQQSFNAAWANPEYALLPDNMQASAYMTPGGESDELLVTGFNFNIPVGADSVNGMEVTITGYSVFGTVSAPTVRIQYVAGGRSSNAGSATAWASSSPGNAVYGGPTATWGGYNSIGYVNRADFGVAFIVRQPAEMTGALVYVDRVLMNVYYTEGGIAKSTGPKVGTVGSNVAYAHSWFSLDNLRADDDVSSSAFGLVDNGYSQHVGGKGYGFTVPLNATVSGIVLTTQKKSNSGNIEDAGVRMRKATGAAPTNLPAAGVWPVLYSTVFSYGNDVEKWGTTWTPAEVNDPEFGPLFAMRYTSVSGNGGGEVDYLAVTVFACLP
jgi:hypothetical protein